MHRILTTIFTCLLLAACAPDVELQPGPPPTIPIVQATATAVPQPTQPTSQPADPTNEPAQPPIPAGQNPDGTFYRGAADAPVTLLEYSDFL